MAQVLRDNPNVTIEMASHTDRWGSEEYNIDLSPRRARSVIDYLISVGIRPDRLQPQGYGEITSQNNHKTTRARISAV